MKFLAMACLIGCSGGDYIVSSRPLELPEDVVSETGPIHRNQVILAQEFEKVWKCENGGQLELIQSSDSGLYWEKEGQIIVSSNLKDSSGTRVDTSQNVRSFTSHPRISASNLIVFEGFFRFLKDVKYSKRNNLTSDSTGQVIEGKKQTEYLGTLVNGVLELQIIVYEGSIVSNPASILAVRFVKCE